MSLRPVPPPGEADYADVPDGIDYADVVMAHGEAEVPGQEQLAVVVAEQQDLAVVAAEQEGDEYSAMN